MYRYIAGTFALTAALAVVTPAYAVHVFDPPWLQNPTAPQWAGGSITNQSWEFGTQHGYINNPFGTPTVQFPGGSMQPVTDWPLQPGVPIPTWHIDVEGGGMLLTIPNDPLPRPVKYIHLQYTSDKAGGIPVTTPGGTATPGGVAGHGGEWYTYEWNLEIRPNPPQETIWIPFPVSSNIEEVHVSTICVPEPASLALLALGGLILRRKTSV